VTQHRLNYRLAAVILLLVVLHFALRPFMGDPRSAPDLLILALLVYAIRARPGRAAIAGFLVGLLADSLTPVAFGAAAFAHSVVGYLAAWGKAVFFAENLVVNAGLIMAGTWGRDLLVLVLSGQIGGSVFWKTLAIWSPLQASTTALVGVGVLVLFHRWLQIRISE
jgi:rod shape-determining protein MreD